jgi:adenylate kinase family enzyme
MPVVDLPGAPRRIAVLSSASGSGKTTLARALATRHGLPYHELDALHHGPDWSEPSAREFKERVAPIVAGPTWVIDGSYRGKLGDLVIARADLVVWIDLPRRVWLPRLVGRSIGRIARREELWNGNRETFSDVFVRRDSLVRYAWRTYPGRRRRYELELAPLAYVRLRTRKEVRAFEPRR